MISVWKINASRAITPKSSFPRMGSLLCLTLAVPTASQLTVRHICASIRCAMVTTSLSAVMIFTLKEDKEKMTLDVFLLILRLLFIVFLYLFLMQVVIAISHELPT